MPLARIISYGFGGVDPDEMGMGPVPASKMALDKVGLNVSDLDLVESNEAFASFCSYIGRNSHASRLL